MAIKQVKDKAKRISFRSKLNTTWTALIAGCTILSMGFASGFYISDVLKKIERITANQKHNEQLYDQKRKFDKKIEEINHKCNLLEIRNGVLRKK